MAAVKPLGSTLRIVEWEDLPARAHDIPANFNPVEAFREDFDAIVARLGWDYNGGRDWRTRVIYETNLNTSYARAAGSN